MSSFFGWLFGGEEVPTTKIVVQVTATKEFYFHEPHKSIRPYLLVPQDQAEQLGQKLDVLGRFLKATAWKLRVRRWLEPIMRKKMLRDGAALAESARPDWEEELKDHAKEFRHRNPRFFCDLCGRAFNHREKPSLYSWEGRVRQICRRCDRERIKVLRGGKLVIRRTGL